MTLRLLPLLALAACGGDEAASVEITLTAPTGELEVLPGGTLDIAWRLTGEAQVVVGVRPVDSGDVREIHDAVSPAGDDGFAWDGRDLTGTLLQPDVYALEATAYVDGDEVDAAAGNVFVHGVVVTDPTAGVTRVIRGSDGATLLHLRTVSQRVMLLDTTLVDGATELLVDHREVNGEFVPFNRDIPFDGTTEAGEAIPAGVYQVVVDASDPDSDLAYRVTGGSVDWAP